MIKAIISTITQGDLKTANIESESREKLLSEMQDKYKRKPELVGRTDVYRVFAEPNKSIFVIFVPEEK